MNVWRRIEQAALALPAPGRWTDHLPRIALAGTLAVLTYLLFPAAPALVFPIYEVGAVATDNVIAPFAFDVKKDPAVVERQRRELARSVPPIFVYTREALDTSRRLLDGFERALTGDEDRGGSATVQKAASRAGVDLRPDEAAYLADPTQRSATLAVVRRVLERAGRSGTAADAALDDVGGQLSLRRGDILRTVAPDEISTFSAATERLRADVRERGSVGASVTLKLATAFFRPTVVPDFAATERERSAVRGTAPEVLYTVRAGEKIVGAHEVVGQAEHAKLRTLQGEIQGHRGTEHLTGRIAGAVLFNFLVLALTGVTLALFRRAIYADLRSLVAIAAVYLTVLTAAAVVPHLPGGHVELIPIALAAVMLGLLFDARISLVATMVLAVLVGGQGAYRGTNALFISLIAGAAGAFGTRFLRRRNQAIQAVLTIVAAYAMAAVALGLTLGWPVREFIDSVLWGTANAVVSVPVALLLLPLAEQATGIETDHTLLEWSDLNRPLMQRLMLEAPGTHAHTMVIANLAEAAATAIGANGLLARVGAYYHDIGKIKKPQYFIENQPRGKNPHDKLKPQMSAAIIRGHVRDGLDLAEEYRVPRILRAFISEHHGSSSIGYFLEKARERDAGVVPNTAEFQYPGPPPRSAETTIVMLADGVEAAARALPDPGPERIREIIDKIVTLRIEQGQLRDAPLTLAQLTQVKAQFARVLIGQHHGRIDYPVASVDAPGRIAPA
ncbi:MAG: HDIG domain-containing protein [Gemmatimonadaceae bacterium]